MEGKIYKPKEFAKLLGVSVRTLQRWDKKGLLVAHRTPTNRRYYTHEQYLKYIVGFLTIKFSTESAPTFSIRLFLLF